MLVLLDESWDTGFKFDKESSKYFSIWMVIFNDNEDAEDCDKRIDLLKKELGKPSNFEFHYAKSSSKIKEAFFNAVAPYNFFYYGIIINKEALYSDWLKIKESFYKYVCSLVFENAKDKIENATIVIDKNWSWKFESQLQTYLKRKFNGDGTKKIKKVKMQDSHKNNLLQLADYIASGINRKKTKPEKEHYMQIIAHREMYVQFWPKEKPTPIR